MDPSTMLKVRGELVKPITQGRDYEKIQHCSGTREANRL